MKKMILVLLLLPMVSMAETEKETVQNITSQVENYYKLASDLKESREAELSSVKESYQVGLKSQLDIYEAELSLTQANYCKNSITTLRKVLKWKKDSYKVGLATLTDVQTVQTRALKTWAVCAPL